MKRKFQVGDEVLIKKSQEIGTIVGYEMGAATGWWGQRTAGKYQIQIPNRTRTERTVRTVRRYARDLELYFNENAVFIEGDDDEDTI